MNQLKVGGIPIAIFTRMEDAVEAVFSPSDQSVIPGFAVAINPEKVMKSRADQHVMKTLLSATLRFADGIGVVWALRRKGAQDAVRIPGCELWEALMRVAGKSNHPVFLVGAKPSVLKQVRQKLTEEYSVNVVGAQDGYFSASQQDELIERIRKSGAKIVTVAMGSPKQEVFIQQCRSTYPDAFYMGVGGTYDVFVGNVSRAPLWARRWNVEWLYRLVRQPRRLGRQLVCLHFLLLMLAGKL